LIAKYGENDAIIAYNAGEGNLLKWQGEILFEETRQYRKKVFFVKNIYDFKLK
jgi:soluble lytic murein transglycosylase-like protein